MPRRIGWQIAALVCVGLWGANAASQSYAEQTIDLVPPYCDEAAPESEWPKLQRIEEGCDDAFPSPDRHSVILIGEDGSISLNDYHNSHAPAPSRPVFGPALFGWSPKSKSFLINEGRGSGQDSFLRVFHIRDGKIVEDSRFHSNALNAYRTALNCPQDFEPAVWGLGWSEDGAILFAIIQAQKYEYCGSIVNFIAVEFDAETGEVLLPLMGLDTARSRLKGLLPPNLLAPTP